MKGAQVQVGWEPLAAGPGTGHGGSPFPRGTACVTRGTAQWGPIALIQRAGRRGPVTFLGDTAGVLLLGLVLLPREGPSLFPGALLPQYSCPGPWYCSTLASYRALFLLVWVPVLLFRAPGPSCRVLGPCLWYWCCYTACLCCSSEYKCHESKCWCRYS